jgi:hypothetical protein
MEFEELKQKLSPSFGYKFIIEGKVIDNKHMYNVKYNSLIILEV